MSPTTLLPLASLLLALPLVAGRAFTQDTVTHTLQSVLPAPSLPIADGGGCPLVLDARHISSTSMLQAGATASSPPGPAINGAVLSQHAARPTGLYQQVELTLNNPSLREIVSVQVTVHGMSSRWRAIPTANSPATPDLAKTIDIVIDLKGNGHVAKDLTLSRFTAVTSIDLDSIAYADGSRWQASASGACSVTPNALMLVSASH